MYLSVSSAILEKRHVAHAQQTDPSSVGPEEVSHLRQGLLRREPNQAPPLVTLREEAVPVPSLRVGLLSEVQHGPPPGQPRQGNYKTVLQIRIRDSAFLTPESRIRDTG
jgi:hypothetical protein